MEPARDAFGYFEHVGMDEAMAKTEAWLKQK